MSQTQEKKDRNLISSGPVHVAIVPSVATGGQTRCWDGNVTVYVFMYIVTDGFGERHILHHVCLLARKNKCQSAKVPRWPHSQTSGKSSPISKQNQYGSISITAFLQFKWYGEEVECNW
jgi:hypothetical protein